MTFTTSQTIMMGDCKAVVTDFFFSHKLPISSQKSPFIARLTPVSREKTLEVDAIAPLKEILSASPPWGPIRANMKPK